MKILLVRHAEPISSNLAESDICPTDDENVLSDDGIIQAELLGEYLLSRFGSTALSIHSSSMIRAIQTADQLRKKLENITFVCDDRWAERNKDWARRPTVAEIREEERVAFCNPYEKTSFGESLQEHRDRVKAVWEQTLNECAMFDILVLVAHGGTIEHILGLLLDIPVSKMVDICFALDMASFHVLDLKRGCEDKYELTVSSLNVKTYS